MFAYDLVMPPPETKKLRQGFFLVPPDGAEHGQKSSGNQGVGNQSGAESGALGAENAPIDPELAAVVDAWPALPEAIKAGILAMVTAARRDSAGADR